MLESLKQTITASPASLNLVDELGEEGLARGDCCAGAHVEVVAEHARVIGVLLHDRRGVDAKDCGVLDVG